MVKYKIPAVNGKIDNEVAKTIRSNAVWKEKEKREVVINGQKRTVEVVVEKTCIKNWEVHRDHVIVESEKEIEGLEDYKI